MLRGGNRELLMEEKNTRIKLIIAVLLTVIAVALIIGFVISRGKENVYTTDGEIGKASFPADGQTKFLKYCDGFLRVRPDGAHAYNKAAENKWSIAYSTTNVIADVSGECAAFADKGGSVFYVTDGSGGQKKINSEKAIEDIAVASQGVTAVWASKGENDSIIVYDIEGRKLLEIKTGIEKEGTPVDICLSDDGKKMVVSYLTVDGTSVRNWVTFYNFGEVGKSYADRVVGTFSYNDSFIPKVTFMTDSKVLVCKENGFALYKMKEIPELLNEETFAGTIKTLVSSDDHIMVITEDGQIRIFNSDGNLVQESENHEEFSGAAVFSEGFALFTDRTVHLYNINGTEKYKKSMSDKVAAVYEEAEDKYIIVMQGSASVIELGETDE